MEDALRDLMACMNKETIYSVYLPEEHHPTLMKVMKELLIPIIRQHPSDLFRYTFESVRAQRVLKVVIAILLHVPIGEEQSKFIDELKQLIL